MRNAAIVFGAALAISSTVLGIAACSSDHPSLPIAGSTGTTGTTSGGDASSPLSGFVLVCNAAGTTQKLIPAFSPSDPPDYWALRTETLTAGGAGDGGAYTWSTAETEATGTICKTASSQTTCMTDFASHRQLSSPTCAGSASTCSVSYVIATRGDHILTYDNPKLSTFTDLFGQVTTWEEAMYIVVGKDTVGGTCEGVGLGYKIGAFGIDILVPTTCGGVLGWVIKHVDPMGAVTISKTSFDATTDASSCN